MREYEIVYADPPWDQVTYSDKGKGRCPKYDVLSIDDLKTLPVWRLSAKRSALFVWVTGPHEKYLYDVAAAWGWPHYSGVAFTWAKPTLRWWRDQSGPTEFRIGGGYGTRKNTERCYLFFRDKTLTLPRISKAVRELIVYPAFVHSAKPPETRDRIVELFGDRPRIELFARRDCGNDPPPEWDATGLEWDGLLVQDFLARYEEKKAA